MGTAIAMQQVDKQTHLSKQRVGKHVLAETVSGLLLGNYHDNNRMIAGGGVFSWVCPEVI
jgi:hypothetical protein